MTTPQNSWLKAISNTSQLKLCFKTLDGKSYYGRFESKAPIRKVRQFASDEIGFPLNRTRLVFAGKILRDFSADSAPISLRNFNIEDGFTIHVVLDQDDSASEEPGVLPSDASAQKSRGYWEAKASEGDFDTDFHIVDPQSHYHLLAELKRSVVARSEYFWMKGNYQLATISPPNLDLDQTSYIDGYDLPTWLHEKLVSTTSVWKVQDHAKATVKGLRHLWKSYCILFNVAKSVAQMKSQRFCTRHISILQKLKDKDIVEVQKVETSLIEKFKRSLETAVGLILEDLQSSEDLLLIHLVDHVFEPCQQILSIFGAREPFVKVENLHAALRVIRKLTILLDCAVIFYVRSHVSDFESMRDGPAVTRIKVGAKDSTFAFTCFRTDLACLKPFVDQKMVWTFEVFPYGLNDAPSREDDKPKTQSVLARMEDLADLWGPVSAIPFKDQTDLIRCYRVSKGIICRVDTRKACPIQGASFCHYFSRHAFVRRTSSKLFGNAELAMRANDLLLIGALRENSHCKYTMSDFMNENSSELVPLGTRESLWRNDSRSLAIGLSKYLGVTITGTQKLVPQTTLKQHILDKWKANPSRANPGILNQCLAVEASHCTYNARRIPLKQLMLSKSIWPILERQMPDWISKSWGVYFLAALQSKDDEEIFRVWKTFATDRSEMGELVSCVLELLEGTGLDETLQFRAALFTEYDDLAHTIPQGINDWSIALRDTHMTGAFVIMTQVCLNCDLPNHTASSCHIREAYTVLQTRLAIEQSNEQCETTKRTDKFFNLKPGGEHLRQVDGGSQNVLLLAPASKRSYIFKSGKVHDCLEMCNKSYSPSTNVAYLRSSCLSFHGRPKQKLFIDAMAASDAMTRPLPGLLSRQEAQHKARKSVSANELTTNTEYHLDELEGSRRGGVISSSTTIDSQKTLRPLFGSVKHRIIAKTAPSSPKHVQDEARGAQPEPKNALDRLRLREHEQWELPLREESSLAEDDPLSMTDLYGQDALTSFPPQNTKDTIVNDLKNYSFEEDGCLSLDYYDDMQKVASPKKRLSRSQARGGRQERWT